VRNLSVIFLLSIMTAVAAVTNAQESNPIVRLNPGLDEIVSPDTKVEKLGGNFGFLEGPVWIRKGDYLLFSDIRANVINKWSPKDGKVSIFLEHSGLTGTEPSPPTTGAGNGSNGITADRHGRVVYCARGDRQFVRLEKDHRRTVLASQFEGKPFVQPNDLVYKSDGSLYMTDVGAVYLLKDTKLQLLIKDIQYPNGLAFSPNEKTFYVNDTKSLIIRYDVQPDDTVAHGQVFIDMSSDKSPGIPDGMKVDQKGNVYCSGPGGIWIISPEGTHLGTVLTPEEVTNLAFGDADGKTLYVTARHGLYRIRFKVPGIRP
jgi:gluconolactonase